MELEEVVKYLKEKRNVQSVIQFGSSLNRKKFRDIDLCLLTSPKLSFSEKLRLRSSIPAIYDVTFYDDLPLQLKKVVLTEGKILFTRDYYTLLKQIQYLELEYPRFAAFLEEYHAHRMAEI